MEFLIVDIIEKLKENKELKDLLTRFINQEEIMDLLDENKFKELFNIALKQNIEINDLNNFFKHCGIKTNIDCESFKKDFYQNKIDDYLTNKNLKIIEDKHFFNNNLLKEIDINGNVERIGNHCFSGCKNLETINFKGKGLLKAGVGSHVFDDCISLKRVNSDNTDVLHYRHDNFGTPFVSGVKIFVNNQEIVPLQMEIEYIPNTWDINSGYIIKFDDKTLIKSSQIGVEKHKLTQKEYFNIVEYFNDRDNFLRGIHVADNSFDSPSYEIQYTYIGWKNTIYLNMAFKEKEPVMYKELIQIINSLNNKFKKDRN